jgi:hypothetical protein
MVQRNAAGVCGVPGILPASPKRGGSKEGMKVNHENGKCRMAEEQAMFKRWGFTGSSGFMFTKGPS